MKYIEKNIKKSGSKNEEIIVKAKINFLAYIPYILLFAICVAGAIIVYMMGFTLIEEKITAQLWQTVVKVAVFVILGILLLKSIAGIIALIRTELAVTNKRVIGKVGVLGLYVTDVPIDKIDNVSTKASFIGRIFRFSTILIRSTSLGILKVNGVYNSNQIKNSINNAIEQHAEEARKELAGLIK